MLRYKYYDYNYYYYLNYPTIRYSDSLYYASKYPYTYSSLYPYRVSEYFSKYYPTILPISSLYYDYLYARYPLDYYTRKAIVRDAFIQRAIANILEKKYMTTILEEIEAIMRIEWRNYKRYKTLRIQLWLEVQ